MELSELVTLVTQEQHHTLSSQYHGQHAGGHESGPYGEHYYNITVQYSTMMQYNNKGWLLPSSPSSQAVQACTVRNHNGLSALTGRG